MKTVKVSELIGAALDWAVAMCEGDELAAKNIQYPEFAKHYPKFSPSTDWAHGGPLVEREGLQLATSLGSWVSSSPAPVDREGCRSYCFAEGPTPLVAAMRCYCLRVKGHSVEVPADFCP